MNKITLFSLVFLSATLSYNIAYASNSTLNFNFSADAEYDSSVGIIELDDFSQEGDSAWIVKGGVKGKWQKTDIFSFRSQYEFTNRNYANQNGYDQIQQHISLNPQFAFSKIKMGFRHDALVIGLAGDDFMNYRLNSLSIEGSISPSIYSRVAYNFAEKKLNDFPDRNALIKDWTGDLFWFSGSGRHLVMFSTKFGEENAQVTQYDFTGTQLKLGYSFNFHIGNQPTKLKLTQTQSKRRYAFASEENPQSRADNKLSSKISLETEVNKKLLLIANLELSNNKSNLESVNYKEEITTVGLRLKL